MDSNKKRKRYHRLYQQISNLIEKEKPNPVARMATIVAVLHNKMEYFFWTGFYLLDKDDLIVGPYQGPLACIKLNGNKGVCWEGIKQKETVIVPDVHKFPGHIACDSRSNSEIVIPLFRKNGEVVGVLDVDSKVFNSFDEVDAEELQKIVNLIDF